MIQVMKMLTRQNNQLIIIKIKKIIFFTMITVKNLCAVTLAAICALTLTGCDQFREKVATLLLSGNPQQAKLDAQQALSARQPAKALELLKPFLEKPERSDPELLLVATRAHAQLGDVGQALRLLQVLVDSGAVQKQDLMVIDDFSSLRTDIRFVSWIANSTSDSTSSTPPSKSSDTPASVSSQALSGVSANIGAGSISATAGGVSVKIGSD